MQRYDVVRIRTLNLSYLLEDRRRVKIQFILQPHFCFQSLVVCSTRPVRCRWPGTSPPQSAAACSEPCAQCARRGIGAIAPAFRCTGRGIQNRRQQKHTRKGGAAFLRKIECYTDICAFRNCRGNQRNHENKNDMILHEYPSEKRKKHRALLLRDEGGLHVPCFGLLKLEVTIGVFNSRFRQPADLQLQRVPLRSVQLLKLGLSQCAHLFDSSSRRVHHASTI